MDAGVEALKANDETKEIRTEENNEIEEVNEIAVVSGDTIKSLIYVVRGSR